MAGLAVRHYLLHSLKNDIKASITVYFVALPLCLGISLASGTPLYTGLFAGIIGGIVISSISKSSLSVSGPAAGLTAICSAAVLQLGSLELLFIAVAVAGLLQILLGVFRLGGFTHFIPSSVIKGMLVAIGIILISKQIPLLIGYDTPRFWQNALFNIVTLRHGFEHIKGLGDQITEGAIIVAACSLLFLVLWKKFLAKKVAFLPTSIITVIVGSAAAFFFQEVVPDLALKPSQFVSIPDDLLSGIELSDLGLLFSNNKVWEYAVVICFVATLETLLSIEAIDDLDPQNRITPQNRELIAQGVGNFASGMVGGLPITSVIVRSSANAEAGAKTKIASFFHGLWLLITVLFAASVVKYIPYCVLAVILIRTGYNLVKPKMVVAIYKQGREQFLPFIITVISILLTDLLIGVLIGIAYAIYFLIKHTYRAGYTVHERIEGHTKHVVIDLALNVSFLNKKRIRTLLEAIPEYSIVEINGARSVYIDHDILEIFHDFKTKARNKHIQLEMRGISDVVTIGLH